MTLPNDYARCSGAGWEDVTTASGAPPYGAAFLVVAGT